MVPYSIVLTEEVTDTNFVKIAHTHPPAASVDGTLFVESLDIVCTLFLPRWVSAVLCWLPGGVGEGVLPQRFPLLGQ